MAVLRPEGPLSAIGLKDSYHIRAQHALLMSANMHAAFPSRNVIARDVCPVPAAAHFHERAYRVAEAGGRHCGPKGGDQTKAVDQKRPCRWAQG